MIRLRINLAFLIVHVVQGLTNSPLAFDRRSLLENAVASALSTAFIANKNDLTPPSAFTVDDAISPPSLIVPKTKSVVVLGAGGGTGRACVCALLEASRPCIATTRSGNFDYDTPSSLDVKLETASADVTSYESISAILTRENVGAIIFSASASTKGGDAAAVDRDGVLNAARACIEHNIARLVVVSSGAVTRPDSAVYKLLNFVGSGIMEAKIRGEDGMRELYAQPRVVQRGLGYTVIRPGGLTNEPSVGPAGLELNQGDDKSGRLSRLDVASLCVQCLDSADAFDATFECYETATAKPLESVGLSNLLKSKIPSTFKTGRERHGETWEELFRGLARDQGYTV